MSELSLRPLAHRDRFDSLLGADLEANTQADERLDRIANLCARTLAAPVAVVALASLDRYRFLGSHGLEAPWATLREVPLSWGLCLLPMQTRVAAAVEDSWRDPRTKDLRAVMELRFVGYAAAPLVDRHGKPIGALCLLDPKSRHWTPEEIASLTDFAALASAEIEHQTTAATLRERALLLELVLGSMEDAVLVADQAGHTVLANESMHRHLDPGTGATASSPGAGHMQLFCSDKVTPCPTEDVPLARALAGESVRQCELFVRSATFPNGRWQSLNASPVRDTEGAIRGAVMVGRDVTDVKELQEQLVAMSIVDELTQLYNRRGFLILLEQQLHLATRLKKHASLLFVDLDRMKGINDIHGHEAGDEALRDAAKLLRMTFRESDVIARPGGDEFVVFALDVGPDRIALLLERLRENMARHNATGARPYAIHMSIGVAHFDPSHAERVEDLLKRADAEMYAAKRARKTGGR
jgi:diguanylate cyclase (GGDEF)-like protein